MIEQLTLPVKSKLSIAIDEAYPKKDIGYRFVHDRVDVLDFEERTRAMVEAGQNADLVIFLDNGARMLGGLFNKAFSHAYPDKVKPDLKFLNIGREKILRFFTHGNSSSTTEDFQTELEESIPDENSLMCTYGFEAVEQLRDVMCQGNRKRTERILVVDDIVHQGKTRILATQILKIFYPQSQVEYFSFMNFQDVHLFPLFDYSLTLGSVPGNVFISRHNYPSPLARLRLGAKKEDLAKIAESCSISEIVA